MPPNPSSLTLKGLTLDELTHLLNSTTAQKVSVQKQIDVINSNAIVSVDQANKKIAGLTAAITSINEAIAELE